jgi:hypothetical protein
VPRGGEGRGESASPSTIVLVSRFDVERGGENEHTRRKADIVDPSNDQIQLLGSPSPSDRFGVPMYPVCGVGAN